MDSKTKKIKKLFLIDAFGAILSAFLLGVVLVKFEWFFGIPTPTLYFLAFLPCLFTVYDFYCYFKATSHFDFHLKGIAIVNLLYCVLSLGLAFYHYQEITIWGWVYIVIEIIIVFCIAIIELMAVKNHNQISD